MARGRKRKMPDREIVAADMRTMTREEMALKYGVTNATLVSSLSAMGLTVVKYAVAHIHHVINVKRRSGMTNAQFACFIGVSTRVLESWLYERKQIPANLGRMLYLACQTVLTRHHSRMRNKNKLAHDPADLQ